MEDLVLYLRLILKSWWIVALTALAALSFALISSYEILPLYRSKSQFLVSPGPTLLASEDRDIVRSIEALDRRSIVDTYSEILDSASIHQAAAEMLQLEQTVYNQYDINAVGLPSVSVLELTVVGPNPEVAALLANNIGQYAIDFIEGRYLVYDVVLLKPATPANSPFNLTPERDAGVALVLGLVFGLALAVLRESLRTPFNKLRLNLARESQSNALKRHYFQQYLTDELAKNQDTTLTLGFIRLDGLANSQDNWPNSIVQNALRHITATIQSEVRGKDMVGRWDETTFAILLPGTDYSIATFYSENIQQALSPPFEVGFADEHIPLKPRLGLTVWSGTGSSDSLIDQAETALAKIEPPAKTTISFFSNELNSSESASALAPFQQHRSLEPTLSN